ncbi:MAG: molecular chaperone TorD family protein [Casimicrobiaceae bacterium]
MFAHRVDPEDQARADFYALLARLYRAAPDAELLAAIAAADELTVASGAEHGDALAGAWRDLLAASSVMDPEAATEEYQSLFIGVGRSEVSLHGSAYAKAAGGGPLLVQVREGLAGLELARLPESTVIEDHLAVLLETMRALILGTGRVQPLSIDRQREFFNMNIAPWVTQCCNAIRAKGVANYYVRVAQLTSDFAAIERDSFAIER